MTGFLSNYTIMLLLFLLLIYIVTIFKPKPYPKQSEPRVKIKAKPRTDEVMDTLDWMLSNQIITASEYTKLVGKCLPFLDG